MSLFFEPSCFSLLAVQPCPNQSCTLSPCSEVHLRSGVVSLENSFSMLYPSRSTVTPGRAKKLWRSLQWHPALGSVAADARVSPVALPWLTSAFPHRCPPQTSSIPWLAQGASIETSKRWWSASTTPRLSSYVASFDLLKGTIENRNIMKYYQWVPKWWINQ